MKQIGSIRYKILYVTVFTFLTFSVASSYAQKKPKPAGTPVLTTTGTSGVTTTTKTGTKIPTNLNFNICAGKPLTINDGILKPGLGFTIGSYMWAPNHAYHMEFTSNGDLAVFNNVKIDGVYQMTIWTAGVAKKGAACAYLSPTGSLRVDDANKKSLYLTTEFTKPFPTGNQPSVEGPKDAKLYLENDGSLVVRSASTGDKVVLYNGADQNKKPDPKYLGMGIAWWDLGYPGKVGTVFGPSFDANSVLNKMVLICDKSGLLIRPNDQNEVAIPKYISKIFNKNDVTGCTFQYDGDITVESKGSGVWHLGVTKGLNGNRVQVNDLGNAEMINTKKATNNVVWDSKNGIHQ